MLLTSLIGAGLLTFAFPDELRVDYGKLRFGTECPQPRGKTEGLHFRICDRAVEGDHLRVCGIRYGETRQIAEVWTATTTDGLHYADERLLYRLPPPDREWLAGDVVLVDDGQLLAMICDCGRPPTAGHRFHVFAGGLDGTGWTHRNEAPVYRGQDAFGLVWDAENQRLINYQTTYQQWPKRYADNMGDSIRRVLHIRTSPDGLVWTPGGSFGLSGPFLPEDQLIVPDAEDPPELEFYKFRPAQLGDFWAGCMGRYVAEPPGLPRSGTLPHGPLLDAEWWVSRDGFHWQRPFRETTDLTGVPYSFAHFFHPPLPVGDEWRWVASNQVYALRPDRMFYVESLANAEVTTPVFTPGNGELVLNVSFGSIRLNRQSHLRQGYLMAELRTAEDVPIPGFEKEKCRFLSSADTALALAWEGQVVPKEPLRLRLYFRDLRIYSLAY